jgi:hypothetical protein
VGADYTGGNGLSTETTTARSKLQLTVMLFALFTSKRLQPPMSLYTEEHIQTSNSTSGSHCSSPRSIFQLPQLKSLQLSTNYTLLLSTHVYISVSLILALQSIVEHSDMAAGTALVGFVRSLFTTISAVIGGSIFQSEIQLHYKQMVSVVLPRERLSLTRR